MRKLRNQLIGLLLLVALLPAVPAAWTVRELMERSLAGGAEEAVLEGARAGLDGVRELLDLEKERFTRRMAAGASLDTLTSEDTARLDPEERRTLETIPPAAGSAGDASVLRGPGRVRLGGSEHLAARVQLADGEPVWVVAPLPGDLAARAESLAETVRRVETLRRDRDTIVRGLVLTFLAVYGLILALVVILALLVASRLTRPLQVLGEGIDRVAGGDLDARVDSASAGHLSRLGAQFNRMTERLKTQQEDLVRLEKLAAWRNLARRLAHEIKNPLTPIRLAAEQMRDEYPGDDATYRRLLTEGTGIIEEEVRSLRALVREFSDFARLPEPRMRTTAVRSLLEDLGALYGEDRVRTAPPGDPSELTAWCDPDEIHRVLVNLVNNALEAQTNTGNADPVEITVERAAGSRISIAVLDRGPGVKPEDRRRVFSPDYSSTSGGMGLGLSIVEGIVHAHGGSIEVTDRAGGGAVFRFTLTEREPASRTEPS